MSPTNLTLSGPRPSPAGVSVRKVRTGLLVFYALALALNGVSLHRNNERLPYGPVRSFWVAASAPVAKGCAALGFDRPRDVLARTAGKALNE
jgi:hypothetical protein